MADNTDLNINQIADNIAEALATIEWRSWGEALICITVGFVLASFASSFAGRILARYTSAHYTQIVRRIIYYGIIVIFLLFALGTLHLNMQVLGIATLITLALGFASQTAMSNVVTGLFLVFERPFSIGDKLEYNGVVGELLAIDLLSIKILTDQNTLVRIPNEMLLKSQFTNLTKFPIRRLDIAFQVNAEEDLKKIRKILFDLAKKNPQVLETPAPKLLFDAFTDDAIKFTFAVWVETDIFYTIKHLMPCEMQQTFKEHGIKLPVLSVRLENPVT